MYVEQLHFHSGTAPTTCSAWATAIEAGTLGADVDYGLQVALYTDGGAPVGPGTYQITQVAAYPGWAAVIQVMDARSGANLESTNAGTVTVTSVGASVAGTYSAQLIEPSDLSDAGAVTGTFDVPVCNGIPL